MFEQVVNNVLHFLVQVETADTMGDRANVSSDHVVELVFTYCKIPRCSQIMKEPSVKRAGKMPTRED